MKIVDSYDDHINFSEYISTIYRNKNKNKLDEEKEKYRRQYQNKIQQEQNENWREGNNESKNDIRITSPMRYIVTDGIKHVHMTGTEGTGCNDKPKKLTADTLMKRQGRPFHDP